MKTLELEIVNENVFILSKDKTVESLGYNVTVKKGFDFDGVFPFCEPDHSESSHSEIWLSSSTRLRRISSVSVGFDWEARIREMKCSFSRTSSAS